VSGKRLDTFATSTNCAPRSDLQSDFS
jgi:hypothetical protein